MSEVVKDGNKLSSFIASLKEAERSSEATNTLKNSTVYRNGTIEDIRNKYKDCVATRVFLALYRNGIPTSEENRGLYASNLDQKMLAYVESAGEESIYKMLSKAGKKGSKSAARLVDRIDKYVDTTAKKFYEEDEKGEKDYSTSELEDIAKNSDTETPDIIEISERIKNDMDLDQVSDMIEANVKTTIANEIKIAKDEEDKLNELEASLAENDEVVNEEALENAYIKAGFRPNAPYKPTLFNGIMISEMNKLITEDCSDEVKQKKAFFESCKEMTVLQTLKTFDIIDINVNNIQRYADKYATGY